MIGFPGIGLEFQRNPAIFRITDNFALTWYGLILASGFLLAVLYCLRQAKHFGLKQDEILDMLFCATPAGIIGARLYYVAFNWTAEFRDDPIRVLFTWQGGMAIYGSIIGAVIAAALFCWVRHINIGAMLDIGAIGLLIGQAVGRWGNFVNGEVYGKETAVPWRMRVYNMEVHPLFLYESLWNILGLVLLRLIMKKRKYNGQLFTLYIAWYGLGRGLLEGMRDSAFNLMLGKWMISQVLAYASFLLALALLFYMTLFKKHPPLLAWTAGRDEYEAYRKARKAGAADDGGTPGDGSGENETELPDEEGGGDGNADGRESAGEDDPE
ncbi:MAG: prolipoprotein diacylglyceryl transferase [Oscillospiraceae bacterium]|jgi:phosphatidylglycerol:prolipoprotein diacylglycerol transferase|nr:prolipoprotein diacylglyceryl transferase [Oscillospiraceae bacterium]